MSTKQAVTIVSRALAVYFLTSLLTDLTYIPTNLHSLFHHAETTSAMASPYLRNSDLLWLSFRLLRMIVLFFAVQWFYRAGPSIQRYFLSPSDEELDSGASSTHSAL
jgi:hypothetical protein